MLEVEDCALGVCLVCPGARIPVPDAYMEFFLPPGPWALPGCRVEATQRKVWSVHSEPLELMRIRTQVLPLSLAGMAYNWPVSKTQSFLTAKRAASFDVLELPLGSVGFDSIRVVGTGVPRVLVVALSSGTWLSLPWKGTERRAHSAQEYREYARGFDLVCHYGLGLGGVDMRLNDSLEETLGRLGLGLEGDALDRTVRLQEHLEAIDAFVAETSLSRSHRRPRGLSSIIAQELEGQYVFPLPGDQTHLQVKGYRELWEAKARGEQYEGGLVLDAAPGLYGENPVVWLDWNSTYPGIIRGLNIDRSSMLGDGTFALEPRGVVPGILDRLQGTREAARGSRTRERAVKLLMSKFYGDMGDTRSLSCNLLGATTITAVQRGRLVGLSLEIPLAFPCSVLGGHTDSVALLLLSCGTIEEGRVQGGKMRDWVNARGEGTVKLEEPSQPTWILNKTQYVKVVGGVLQMKGLETRSNSQFTNETLAGLLGCIMLHGAGDPEAYLEARRALPGFTEDTERVVGRLLGQKAKRKGTGGPKTPRKKPCMMSMDEVYNVD